MKRLLPALVLIVFVSFLIFALTRPVKNVSCILSAGDTCPDVISDNLNKIVGLPQWRFSEALKKQMRELEEVESYQSKITPNGNISITLTLRAPSIALRAGESSLLTLYTDSGLPAGESSVTNLPIVTIREQIDAESIPFIASFASELTKTLTVKDMNIIYNSLVVTTSTDMRLIYPLSGDIDKLLGVTLIVFSQLNETQEKLMIKDTTIKEVDFRYTNPVLRSGGK